MHHVLKRLQGEYAFKYPYKNELEKLHTKNPQAKISDTSGFTTDNKQIKRYISFGIENFKFISADNGLFCLDIDAKEGKGNGLNELLKVFNPDTLPDELRDIENFFPCYVKTPNNGYHLYFKYNGAPIKNTVLFPCIEAKHGSPGLTAAGSYKEGKPYILYGELDNAPPLFGLILEKIKKQGLIQQETKEQPQKRKIGKVRKPTLPVKNDFNNSKITLDTLAAETSGGNHDRQVQFAGKVCRLQMAAKNKGMDFENYTMSAVLAYVKENPGIFGTGKDTESTVKSVFRDNRGI